MRYLHTMVRVTNLDETLHFFCDLLGMVEVRRIESEKGRYTNIFLAASEDEAAARDARAPVVELTYNWDPEDYSGGRKFGYICSKTEGFPYQYMRNIPKISRLRRARTIN